MEKIGIIDLGSNTARLVIVDMFADGHYMVVDELKESVRLGQDMDRDGFLKPQRIAETIKTLKMFKRLCDTSGVERIIAVGTAAVRRAKNQRSFLDEIQVSCNITIRVLSEEEEALLVYRGVINSMDIPKGLILEIGGGSTKIIYYNRRNVLGFASLPFGAVTLTDLFVNDATPEESAKHVEEFFTEQLKKVEWLSDIDPETLCLDPAKAEELITPRTKAIVPVHVYGNMCDVEGFERLGKKYGVKIIYDAAHAFGVFNRVERVDRVERKSIGCCGDMSMFSFHPTKLFHSCEGGLLVFKDAAVQEKLFELRNFAIRSETECVDVGSNAKMNELQALMGLECLKKIDDLLDYRQKIYATYKEVFDGCDSVKLIDQSCNKAYVPVLFKDFETRERVYAELQAKCNVFSRRYFYPLLTDFAPYVYAKGICPIAEDLASRVLTLPTYYGLPLEDVKVIANDVLEIV